MPDLGAFLAGAEVDEAVFALRPDYRALLIAADGIEPSPGDPTSEALLLAAEEHVRAATAATPLDQLPHIAAWREAYRAFGAKPQRTRNSVEALTRRAATGLPRVNRLTDLYNAVSVLHEIPVGGEDLEAYVGPPRLVVATGAEPFATAADGSELIEHPEPGEVVWRDDDGVTCRRWNWRQCRRTQLGEDSRAALFILDALQPLTDQQLTTAAADLVSRVQGLGPDVRIATRLIAASHPSEHHT